MTAVPANPRVSELRDLFRHLSDFRATYETTGLDEVTTPYGQTWSLWDLEYLLRSTDRLTLRQRQAITLCLVHGVKESDAARLMGVSPTNPVMMYATLGLQRLLDMVDAGDLGLFGRTREDAAVARARHVEAIASLAKEIHSKVTEVSGCWLFPNRLPREPRIMVRSRAAWNGYVALSPMQVLWTAYIGPVPEECSVEHQTAIPRVSIACSNPYHGELIQPPHRRARMEVLAARYNARRTAA